MSVKKSIYKTPAASVLFLCNVPSRHKYGKTGKIVLGTVACHPKKFLPALAKILGTNLRLIFCLVDLSIGVSVILKSPTIIVLLLISTFILASICPSVESGQGSPSGLGPAHAHHPPRLHGSISSSRKPSLIPTPLPQSGPDASPGAPNYILGFPSGSTCRAPSQMPLLHARSPSCLWGGDCTS